MKFFEVPEVKMRVQLNLNRYYDGLNLPEVNAVFSSFMNMKMFIDEYHDLFEYQKRSNAWETLLKITKKGLLKIAGDINELMQSLGKKKYLP